MGAVGVRSRVRTKQAGQAILSGQPCDHWRRPGSPDPQGHNLPVLALIRDVPRLLVASSTHDVRDVGSPTWARTRDLRINSPSLYRLSYRGIDLIPNAMGRQQGQFYVAARNRVKPQPARKAARQARFQAMDRSTRPMVAKISSICAALTISGGEQARVSPVTRVSSPASKQRSMAS